MATSEGSFQNNIQNDFMEAWGQFIDNMKKSLDMLEEGINEAAEMTDACTSEWCIATEHVLDELGNSLFSISEPRWSSDEDSKKIKELKRRLHDLYAKYKSTAQ